MVDEVNGTHYGSAGLVDRLKFALSGIGDDQGHLSVKDLAPLDQFHSRGLDATIELAEALHIGPTARVLDIGSGLGGPSRYLAHKYGCTVYGIDLSAPFVEAATYLAGRTGLTGSVSYQCENALSLPFSADTFDIAWTQHVAMNISDRATLYKEAFRVLRPGGRFAIFDVVEASGEPLYFPVPWARDPADSFLVTVDRMRELLIEQGFREGACVDSTAAGIAWFAARQKASSQQAKPPALGIHLLLGSGFADMSANLVRNLREGRAALVQAIFEKPLDPSAST